MDQDMFTPELKPEQSPRKNNKFLIIIISIAIAVAAAIPLTYYLMFFRDGALERSIDKAFIDSGKVAAYEQAWRGGYDAELNIHLSPELSGLAEFVDADIVMSGTNNNAKSILDLTLSASGQSFNVGTYLDDDILAVRGLGKDKDKYISLDSKNARLDLTGSVFSPNSGSDYALDYQSYSTLVDIIDEYTLLMQQLREEYTEETEVELEKELLDAVNEIERKIIEKVKKSTSFGFTSEFPFIYRQTRYGLDSPALVEICDTAIEVLEDKNDIEYASELKQIISSYKTLFTNNDFSAELMYHISGGKLTYAYFILETAEAVINNKIEIILDFDFGFSEQTAILELKQTEYRGKNKNINDTIFNYQKDKKGVTLTVSKSTDYVIGDNEWKPTYTSIFDFGLLIDENDAFELWLKGTTIDLTARGIIKADNLRKNLELEINSLTVDAQDYLKGSVFNVNISKRRAGISVPESDRLSEMTTESQEEFAKEIPAYELNMLMYAMQGEYEDMPKSVDGYPVAPVSIVNDKILQYTLLYKDYIQLMQTYGINGEQCAWVYDKDIHMYVLLRYVDYNDLSVEFLHNFTDEYNNYHKCRVVGDRLEVHDFDVNIIKEATCSEGGEAIYTCNTCGYKFQMETPREEHRWLYVEKKPSTCTEHGFELYKCRVCGETLEKEIPLAEHNYQISEAVEATCIEYGYTIYTCSICGDSYELKYLGAHNIKPNTVEIMLDNGKTYNEHVYSCQLCGYMSYVIIDEYLRIVLSALDDGTYVISDITTLLSDREKPVFCLTEEMFPGIRISGFVEDVDWRILNACSIRIPEGIRNIDIQYFRYEQMAEVLVLPSTLEKIENGTFYEKLPLKRIYYAGTARQWARIDLGQYKNIWSDVEIIFAPDGVEPGAFADLLTGN